jgi:CheY-like chemotaxis protein
MKEIMKMPKILVAEDDPNLARYYVTLLSQWNCETVVEPTGTDAIRRAATFQPDIALLGVVMPEMGGVEAAIELLEICPGTKIVLVTESVPPKTVEQLETQGYHFETLPAPFSREELHTVVFDALKAKSKGGETSRGPRLRNC